MKKSGRQVKAPQVEELRQHILAKYKTPHAFCRGNPDLKRSTVYQVLAGKYPGNTGKQVERIYAALAGVEIPPPGRQILTEAEAYTVLQETKCAHCRKLDKRSCPDCRTQTEREARALTDYVRSREAV